jgi:hypothetical protein
LQEDEVITIVEEQDAAGNTVWRVDKLSSQLLRPRHRHTPAQNPASGTPMQREVGRLAAALAENTEKKFDAVEITLTCPRI